MIRALDQMWTWFPTMFLDTFAVTAHTPVEGRDTDGEEHAAVLDALAAGEGARAEQLLADHVMYASQQLVGMLREAAGKELQPT